MLLVITSLAIAYYYMYGKKHKKKEEEEKPADGKKPEEKKPHGNESHGPGFFTKLFWRTVAVVGSFYLITICFPAGWQNLKDWGSSLIRSNARSSTNRPREYFTETVTVTSAGFSPFRLINEKIDCTVESGDVKIYVSEWDGSNEHVYNANGEDYALSTPHHYKFVAKPGTTAVVSYTITPAKK